MKQALIIIDIQNDYFQGGTMTLVGSKEAGDKARLVLDKFRASNQPIIHIQHLAAVPEAPFFVPNTYGAEINDCVKPMEGEKVIIKYYPNSFRETELLEYLKANDISNLVIVGMMTHMCVDATTRAAKDYGFNCVVVGDACATKGLEIGGEQVQAKDVQIAFLSALEFFYSKVITTNQFLEERN